MPREELISELAEISQGSEERRDHLITLLDKTVNTVQELRISDLYGNNCQRNPKKRFKNSEQYAKHYIARIVLTYYRNMNSALVENNATTERA